MDGGDWSYANLRALDLGDLALRGLRLVEADPSESDLRRSDLRDCGLSRAPLRAALLAGTDLRGANLDGVDLRELSLRGTRIDPFQAAALARSYGADVVE